MPTVHEEREDKFDVAVGFVVPDLREVVPGARVELDTVRLASTYYDTADGTLLAHHVTLRRREGDEDVGWQLKVPGKGMRTELHLPLTADGVVPARLQTLVAGISRGAALAPVAELRTIRRLHRVLVADRVLVEVADDEVHATRASDPFHVVDWREVEAELVNGDAHALQVVGARLVAAGATPSSSRSKLAHALGAEAAPSQDAAGLVRAYLQQQLVALGSGDVALRRGLDPVHKTRVAVRRLRSVLRVFAPVLAENVQPLLDELSWYQDLLGEVRDRQVQRARFAAAIGELPLELVLGPVASDVEHALLHEQVVAQENVFEAIDSERYRELLAELVRWTREPPVRSDATAAQLRALARKADRRGRCRLRRALKAGDTERMHAARRALKRSRYASELVAPVGADGDGGGGKARRTVRRAKRLQDLLGEVQDSVVAAEILQRLGATLGAPADRNGFTYGVLWQREREHAERLQRRIARADP